MEKNLTTFEGDTLAEVLAAAMGSEWGDEQVAEAVALFEGGDFQGARALANEAACSLGMAQGAEGDGPDDKLREPDEPAAATVHEWRVALDELAGVYDDAGDTDRAEALYLRILAWREGVDQYREGNFGVAEHLFQKSPHYRSVEDATWFLQGLRPEDGHAVAEVVGLLALGEEVAAKAAVGVWTLALKKENRERIARSGGLELLTKAMQYHLDSAELQAAGCGALRLLSGGHSLAAACREAIAERLGGVALLLAALARHPLDAEVQREGMGALQAVAAKSPEAALSIVESDGIGLALRAVAEYPDEGVGDAACKLIAALRRAAEAEAAQASGEDSAADGGSHVQEKRLHGVAFCAKVLKEQFEKAPAPNKAVVQALLGAFAAFVEDASIAARALILLPTAVQCMARFPGQVKVQQPGVAILRQMLDAAARHVPDDQVKLGPCMALVIAAMRDLPTNTEVQRSALGVLAGISQDDNGLKTLAVRAGGISAAIEAMKRFPQDPDLQSGGLGALTRLCDTLGRASTCQKAGGMEVVVAAVRRHASFGRIAEMGCVLLCMFCDDAQLRQQVLLAGALEVAKSLLRTEIPEARHWGHELFRDLSSIAGPRPR